MKQKLMSWRFAPLIVFIVVCVFFARGLFLDPQHLPSAKQGKPLPAFKLLAIEKDEPPLTTKMLKNNKYSLLNVFASWCEACTEEQPFLLDLALKGIPIFGINYKDDSEYAKNWLNEWGNPYRSIGQDKFGKAAIDLGVYGTPETFLIDKNGRILYRHAGPLDQHVWQQFFMPKIKALESEHG